MDFWSIIAWFVAISLVSFAMCFQNSFMIFYNLPALLLVLIGTFAITVAKHGLMNCIRSFKEAMLSFKIKKINKNDLVKESIELAKVARKSGLLAAEEITINNVLLKKGVRALIDGYNIEQTSQILENEHKADNADSIIAANIFASVAATAPYMGMIGTLIGLVKLLSNLGAVAELGSYMAIALLTTLYGALIANIFAIPMEERIKQNLAKQKYELIIVIEALRAINAGLNPKIIEDILLTYTRLRF